MHIVDTEYELPFTLTPAQKRASEQLVNYYRAGQSVLLQAVCGAGKTELVMEVIKLALSQGKRVGFAIARRQVVLEIARRLQQAFVNLKVTAVCQGYTKNTTGDIIVCTTHQLFRFHHYFDLLIIDEPDAFPYKNDSVLHGLAAGSCQGQFIYLTATPDDELKAQVENGKLAVVYLSSRPHGKPLCVPQVFYSNTLGLLLKGLDWVSQQRKLGHKVMVFVPSRKWEWRLYWLFKPFGPICHLDSTTKDKDKVIKQFRQDGCPICVCTSVLERGITIAGVNVMIFLADHQVYDQAALIQMSGRVGRTVKYPSGDCLFLSRYRAFKIDACLQDIKTANAG